MTAAESEKTESFPGSPTGNQSGVGGAKPGSQDKASEGKKPEASYPGSSTGNASGAGDAEAPPEK